MTIQEKLENEKKEREEKIQVIENLPDANFEITKEQADEWEKTSLFKEEDLYP